MEAVKEDDRVSHRCEPIGALLCGHRIAPLLDKLRVCALDCRENGRRKVFILAEEDGESVCRFFGALYRIQFDKLKTAPIENSWYMCVKRLFTCLKFVHAA